MSLPCPDPRPRGFTLIEMLVVLAIVGLSLAIVAGQRPARSGRLELDGFSRTLAGSMRAARATAIGRGRPVDVTVDPVARAIRIDGAVTQGFPGTLAADRPQVFRFEPDGSAVSAGGPAGQVVLTEGGRRVTVGVDWLTGRVRAADATHSE